MKFGRVLAILIHEELDFIELIITLKIIFCQEQSFEVLNEYSRKFYFEISSLDFDHRIIHLTLSTVI